MCRGIRQIALLLAAAAAPAVEAFAPGCPQLTHTTAGLPRTRVVVSDVSDEWWVDDASSDKDLSSSSSDNEKFDLSSNRAKESSSPFLQGEALKELRSDLESYRENLKWAGMMNDQARVASLQSEIEEKEQKDPEIVYNKAKRLIEEARLVSRAVLKPDLKEKLIKHWSEQKDKARECLPRFQLEGLWVGNYGGGAQLVNITYAGDTVVATKVTADDTVPRGQVSFTANLSPPPLNYSTADEEESTSLDKEEHTVLQSKYGESIFPGQGQLAKKDFKDAKFTSGIFIIYDSYRFSFSWVPTRHHVFFVRPSPHETIRLLRDVISKEDEIENMRDHLTRCFELDMTSSISSGKQHNDEDEADYPFKRIKLQRDLELLRNGLDTAENSKKGSNIFSFWRANKWKKYIDRVLGSDTMQ